MKKIVLTTALVGAVLASAVVAPLVAVGAPATQADDDWSRIKTAGKMVVGTAADYAPFEFYNSNYQLDGFDIELFNALGKQLGIEVEFNDFAFEGVTDALRLKQVDAAIAAISVTPERRETLDFSNLYFIENGAALVDKNYSGEITQAFDLAGKKVGVERGTTYQSWAQQYLVEDGIIPQTNLIAYADTDSLVRDLRAGKVDVVLMGSLAASNFSRRFDDIRVAGTGLNNQRLAIATRKGSTLVTRLNEALAKVQADGTYAALARQYLGLNAAQSTPSKSETQVVNAPAAQAPAQSSTPACINGMSFVADLNLDDKNMTAPPVMSPSQQFSKSWRVRNSGTCAWQPNFQLAFTYGNRPEARMAGNPINIGKVVQPGETIDLSASLIAPLAYGTFQGFWNMRDAANQPFGEVIWAGIQVPNPNPPPQPVSPTPVPPPANTAVNPNLRADANWISPGQCTAIRWNVSNVNAVYFVDGNSQQGVGGNDARTVCPTSTSTYILRVVRRDNVTQDFPITINAGTGGAVINFWADSYAVSPRQCTTVRWDVSNVRAVYFNNQGVGGQGTQQVCPQGTTTYTLRVVRNDNVEETRQVTVTTNGGQSGNVNPTPIP